LIDKLGLCVQDESVSSDFDECAFKTDLKISHKQVVSSKYYSKIEVYFSRGRHLVSVSTQPRLAHSPLRLDLNPSHFESFREMDDLVRRFNEPNAFTIVRIDHCVDLQQPLDVIRSSVLVSRKAFKSDFARGHTLTGFTYGKYPELLKAYDKAKEAQLPPPLTRIELQQNRGKVIHKPYTELAKYQDAQPFKNVLLFKVAALDPVPLRKADQQKREILTELVREQGLQGAMKLLNIHNNFRRDFGRFIQSHEELPNLDQMYQQNVRKFFQGGEDGNTQTAAS
jgi:hypothetical protein